MRARDTPAGVAFFQRRPAHRRVRWTGFDGGRREVTRLRIRCSARPGAPARCRHRVLAAGRHATETSDARDACGAVVVQLAAPGPDTVRYGGNTSCVEVELESGHQLVLDAGTGMRPLGVAMNRRPTTRDCTSCSRTCTSTTCRASASSGRCSDPALEVHIWGPASPVQSLDERIAIYLSPPLFPVHLADIPAHLVFHDEPQHVEIGSAMVHAANVDAPGPDGRLPHRGERPGARVRARSRTVDRHRRSSSMPPDWISGHEVAHGADVLFHDAQYGDDEYPRARRLGSLARSTTSIGVRAQARGRSGRAVPPRPVPHRRRARAAARRREGTLQRARWKGLPRPRRHDDDVRRGRSRDHVLTDGSSDCGRRSGRRVRRMLIIDGDGHIMEEPNDIWTRRADRPRPLGRLGAAQGSRRRDLRDHMRSVASSAAAAGSSTTRWPPPSG